jgi:hypothetical protein
MLELAASAENITEQPPKLSTNNSGREVKKSSVAVHKKSPCSISWPASSKV